MKQLILLAGLLACMACSRADAGRADSSAGPLVYISNEMGGTVSVVDPAARQVVSTISVGKRPRGIRASRDGRSVFVALSGSPVAGPGVDESTLPPPDPDKEQGQHQQERPPGSKSPRAGVEPVQQQA